MDRVETVSYTHLDVYKRQHVTFSEIFWNAFEGYFEIFIVEALCFLVLCYRLIIETIVIENIWYQPGSVSYTHLIWMLI